MKAKYRKLLDFKWCIRVAWELNPWVLMGWMLISALLAFLPFMSLLCQKEILNQITDYITTGRGTFDNCLIILILFGCVMILTGISKRLDGDFMYQALYDYYYVGLADRFSAFIQNVELKTLRYKGIKDEYRYVRYMFGRLCSLISELLRLFRIIITILSLLILAGQYSALILLTTVVYLLVIILFSHRFNASEIYNYVADREYTSRTKYYENSVADPSIAKEIRIFHNANYMVSQWDKEYAHIFQRDINIVRKESAFTLLSSFSYYILTVVILCYSIFQIKNGWMNVTIFLILYGMVENMSSGIAEAMNSYHYFMKELRNLGRMREFMDTVPQMEPKPDRMPVHVKDDIMLEVKNVSFSYDDEHEILHDISFQIKKGETVALVGLNGSGKSTLINLLTELYHPTKGTLYFKGIPYQEYPKGEINKDIGIFFQDYKILHNTLAENVGYGDIEQIHNEDRIWKALEKGGAKKLAENLPKGIQTWLVRKVKKGSVNLSGGEQQKVAVSRAHMSDRPVLIFDEPASALDPIAEMKQFQIIKEKLKDRTGILISHRVGFARLADRILVLQDGYLIENGTHQELMDKNGVYAKFFQKQAEWYKASERGDDSEQVKTKSE